MTKRALGPGASCCNEFGCELCTPDAFTPPAPTPAPAVVEVEAPEVDEDEFDFADEEDDQ